MTATDLRPALRDLDQAIASKNNDLASAWTSFDAARKSAVEEGVNFATDKDAFDKLDGMSKGYDAERDALADLKARRESLARMVAADAAESAGAKVDELTDEHQERMRALSMGKTFIASDEYKAVAARAGIAGQRLEGNPVKVASRGEIKTLLSVTVSGADGLAGIPVADRQNIVIPKPLASLDLLDLIPVGATDSDKVEVPYESLYTNAAAETPEGDASPESALNIDLLSFDVRDLTHSFAVTRRSLADVAFISSWIDSRMVDGVRRRLLTQILSGGGTGEDLRGIYETVGIGSVDRSSTSTSMVESLHKCLTTIRLNGFVEPDFVGIHPTDWEGIRLARDESGGVAGTGGYQYGPPALAGALTTWGVPVLVSAHFASGNPIMGRSNDAMLWVREGLTVATSDSHSDYFTKKKVAVMASMRAAFGVLQPKAFCESVA